MSAEDRTRLAWSLEKKWLQMVATADKNAGWFGAVVDAVFSNDPEEAIYRCRDKEVSDQIRKIFEVAH